MCRAWGWVSFAAGTLGVDQVVFLGNSQILISVILLSGPISLSGEFSSPLPASHQRSGIPRLYFMSPNQLLRRSLWSPTEAGGGKCMAVDSRKGDPRLCSLFRFLLFPSHFSSLPPSMGPEASSFWALLRALSMLLSASFFAGLRFHVLSAAAHSSLASFPAPECDSLSHPLLSPLPFSSP